MRLTDKRIADILLDITIICDTREQKNKHIIDYLTSNGIQFKILKLETADYSFELPNYPELGIDRKILVEKKNSLDEIAGNFTKDRDRFTREFERVESDEKIHLVIENATFKKLLGGSYRSKLPSKSFMASLITFNIRYNCPMWFTTQNETGAVIYNLLYYELREYLKNIT